MKAKKVIDLLQREGWQIVRVNGSHHILEKSGVGITVVPVHGKKDIGKGILAKIEQ